MELISCFFLSSFPRVVSELVMTALKTGHQFQRLFSVPLNNLAAKIVRRASPHVPKCLYPAVHTIPSMQYYTKLGGWTTTFLESCPNLRQERDILTCTTHESAVGTRLDTSSPAPFSWWTLGSEQMSSLWLCAHCTSRGGTDNELLGAGDVILKLSSNKIVKIAVPPEMTCVDCNGSK